MRRENKVPGVTVMVQWFVKTGREEEFFAFRQAVAPTTHGFFGEVLFHADVDADESATVFVNIGHWESREDFYGAFPSAKPGVEPEQQPFEDRPRRRHWLVRMTESEP